MYFYITLEMGRHEIQLNLYYFELELQSFGISGFCIHDI